VIATVLHDFVVIRKRPTTKPRSCRPWPRAWKPRWRRQGP
jgi:hypothetical protein